jgi:hypothetical protein
VAECIFRSDFSLLKRAVGQVGRADRIADGIDAGNVGLHLFIDGNGWPAHLEAEVLNSFFIAAGSPPYRNQYLIGDN